jgi:signal transduction histidine kinase
MHIGIRWKLAGTYFLLILFILAATNLYVLRTLHDGYLQTRKATTLGDANIVAITGGAGVLRADRNAFHMVRNFGAQMGTRILILDDSGRVLIDSFDETWLVGRVLQHGEVRTALAGRSDASTRVLADGERVLYAAVPINIEDRVSGAVLLVSGIEDVYTALNEIGARMAAVSLGSGFFAAVLSLGLAGLLTRRINKLRRAVNRMARGHLGTQVEMKRNDELGELAAAFNVMSKELARIDQMRREFLANASHELKSPLSSIKALAQSLMDGREEDVKVYREFLYDIDTEIDRLTRLVNDMLEMTRLEDDTAPLPRTEEDMATLLKHLEALFSARAANKKITLRCRIKEPVRWPVNRDMLTVVLVNLLDNALRYTPAGGEVTLAASTQPDKLVITVLDTGAGIPAEELSTIFERFHRVDKARSRETGGTGLGLAIVKRAVQRMGGEIAVASSPGRGSVFTIKLPLMTVF